MAKTIGIIGITGRMGNIFANLIQNDMKYELGLSFSRNNKWDLSKVFEANDYIVDFSSPTLINAILDAAAVTSKPLILCTTGWEVEQHKIDLIAQKAPVVIAPNTSFGAVLQLSIACQLAKILDTHYDIDILEKHHRNKIDIPSGTALQLSKAIQKVKKNQYNLDYELSSLSRGPRPSDHININSERSGNLPGEHEVSYVNEEEMLSVKHVVFNRNLFAKGALKILNWLEITQPTPGVYTMMDVLNIDLSSM